MPLWIWKSNNSTLTKEFDWIWSNYIQLINENQLQSDGKNKYLAKTDYDHTVIHKLWKIQTSLF